MPVIRVFLLPLILLLSLTSVAMAQDEPSAVASLNSGAVYVGDALVLTVEVSGVEPDAAPAIPNAKELGFDAEFLRQQNQSFSSTVIVNGQVSQTNKVSFLLYYSITPHRAGVFEIPSIEIKADGQTLRTRPVEFRAVQPSARDDLIATLSVSSESPYVGQPIQVSLEVLIDAGSSLNNPVFSLPEIDDRFSVEGRSAQSARRTRGLLNFLGVPTTVMIDRVERNGRSYDRLRAERRVVPQEAGTIEIGPGVWVCDYAPPRSRRVMRVAVPTNAITLTVKDLPKEGQPADFSGLIGKYSIRATAAPTSVRIGDPIRFELTVEGPGDLRRVPIPDLQNLPGFDSGFRFADRDTERSVRDGSVTFRYVLRVITDAVDSIPRVVLNTFDPETAEYTMLETDPIPLDVEPSRVVTAVDGESFSRPTAEAQRVISAPKSLSANRQGDALLRSGRLTLAEAVRSPLVIGTLAAPPLAYFAMLGVIAVRRRSERAAQPVDPGPAARRALAELRRSSSAPAEAIRDAFVCYESLRSAQNPDAVTPGEAVRRIREEQPTLAEQAAALLAACEAARYAGKAEACGQEDLQNAQRLWQSIARHSTHAEATR
ncbi:MAG: BatD family protein [Phycisphaerales bacterium JB065]